MNKLTVKAGLVILLTTTVLAPLSQVRADVTAPPPTTETAKEPAVPLESWLPDQTLRNIVVQQYSSLFADNGLDINNVSKEVFHNILHQNEDKAFLRINGESLPFIRNVQGISVFDYIDTSLSAYSEELSNFYKANPIDWNTFLQTDTNPVTGQTVSMSSLMSLMIDGRLDSMFQGGMDIQFLYDNFKYVGIDPHNVLMNNHMTVLNNDNYKSFRVKLSDLGLSNLVGWQNSYPLHTYFEDKQGKNVSYVGEISGDSIEFNLETTVNDYESQLDGLVKSPNNNDINFPSTPFAQLYFENRDEAIEKGISGYINVPINLTFKSVSGGLIVSSIDEQGNYIVDSMLVEGNVGDPIDQDSLRHPIEGYTFKYVKDNVNITELTKDQQQVFFVYSKDPVPAGSLSVKYLYDDNGVTKEANPVQPMPQGHVGDEYKVEPIEINGFTLDKTKLPDNATGTRTAEDTTVTFWYTKDPVPVTKGTVTVKHIYNSSIQKDTEETLTGNTGSEYKTEARPTGGFHLIKIDGNPTGLFPESDKPITVTYYYSKSDVVPPVKPVDPPIIIVPPIIVQPVTIVRPVIPVNLTNYKVVNSSNINKHNPISKKGILPVTGDNLVYSLVAIIAGLLLVAGGVVLMLKNKRK